MSNTNGGTMEPVGKEIHQMLRESSYTTRGMAEHIGTTTGSMSNVFTNKGDLTTDLALKFEKVFGLGKASEWLHYQVEYKLWEANNGK